MPATKLPTEIALTAALSLSPVTNGQRAFRMDAYDGGKLSVGNFPVPAVIDLAGLTQRDQVKALLHHNPARPVGHMTQVHVGNSLQVEGVATFADSLAELAAAEQSGFRWESSVGVTMDLTSLQEIRAGQRIRVNGREQVGPFILVGRARLNECSFVGLAAGSNTSAVLVAARTWTGGATAERRVTTSPHSVTTQSRKRPVPETLPTTEPTVDPAVSQLQSQLQAEFDRAQQLNANLEAQLALITKQNLVAAANAQCAQHNIANQPAHADLLAQIGEGKITSEQQVQLAVLNASLAAKGAQIQTYNGRSGAPVSSAVLEAAFLLTSCWSEKDLASHGYDQATINAALESRFQGTGLRALTRQSLRAKNHYADEIGEAEIQASIRFADHDRDNLTASATSVSLPSILSNVLNKQMLRARMLVSRVIPQICKPGTVNDYKSIKMLRLNPSGQLKQIGPDGEAESLGLSEDEYSNQAKQYAGFLSLPEQYIINDDLNAFNELGAGFGKLTAATEERIGFKTLLSAIDTFWTVAKKNRLADGTGNAFSLASLKTAVTLFMRMGDGTVDVDETSTAKDLPIMAEPSIVLTGTGDAIDAGSIYTDQNLITGSDITRTSSNPYKGKFRPLASPYLDSTRYGNDTQWLLLMDPAISAVLHVVYLMGRQNPRIKRWDRMPGKFGIQWDVDHTFGFALHDDKAGVYAKGKA